MRTIKFRGKRIDNGEWINGYYYQLGTQHYIRRDIHIWEVNPETVGQFTGLFDKNGKEIYEGDVLKIESWSLLWVVIFDTNKGHFTCKGINNDAKMDYIPYYHCEIINNITDNPELLKN